MKKINDNPKNEIYEYAKIINPKIWIFLVAILILVFGILFWTVFARIETIIKVGVSCKDENIKCYLSEENMEKIKNNEEKIPIYIDKKQFFFDLKTKKPFKIEKENFSFAMHISNLEKENWAYLINFKATGINNGDHVAYIVTQKFAPISLFIK